MSQVGDRERKTQNRLVKLFKDQLGYTYLGNWEDRPNNSNIEESILRKYLKEKKGDSDALIDKAIYELQKVAGDLSDGLYAANKRVYSLLRYGVEVKAEIGENTETVHLIEWGEDALNNEFAIAEEVTLYGNREKRPDIVLYVNGIALGVIELKRSTISIGEGIRQNITNQQKEFIQPFFTTIQWVFAGNDTEGLRYGTIRTPEKFYLKWKENSDVPNLLDKYLLKLCEKQRFLEIIYDFIVFDAGIKKLCRPHQYFGVKAAQDFMRRHESGIIWHMQGSGKSLVMVWLAKWLLENNPNARVIVLTDRDELDKQIERVFGDAGEKMVRTKSGKDLMEKLALPSPRLLCSLIHKFGKQGVDDYDKFIADLKSGPSLTIGELFVFVDECHRSQSNKLHKAMKAILRDAVFVGFTGTPLLKQDRQTSLEVFGRYIHTYKFNEAKNDRVVLDLNYEARDIEQKLSSQKKIDKWFAVKTRGLNEFQKFALKKQWGTMQKLLSSQSRLSKIVSDIVFDFNTKPRLSSGLGNALLVAPSIYDACRYFELFQKTELKGKCGIVTSYIPSVKDINTEDTGANTETEKQYLYNTYKSLLHAEDTGEEISTETYEDRVKKKFIDEPANMKLLVVVDKLLVGFDAPPCTYIYIDKSMQDHGVFQAICRVNRLDSDDKDFGYIVDYKDLFKKVENAVAVYTSELDYDTFDKKDVDILLNDRLKKGKERLDSMLEELSLLCEPVPAPKDSLSYIRYFCGDPEKAADLADTEPRRTALYSLIVALIRAYANISDDMEDAGYTRAEIAAIEEDIKFYLDLREEIKFASGETLDPKAYEADMRHLIDTYIQADEPRTISNFEGVSLLDLIVKSGIADAINKLPKGIKKNKKAVAETIENNVRKKIIKDRLIDPAYFEEMSKLLDAIIAERNAGAIEYEEFLKKIAELSKKVCNGAPDDLPPDIKTSAQRALYNNLAKDSNQSLMIDAAVKRVKKADWRGNQIKENEIKTELFYILKDKQEVERIFDIIKQQREY
jgi:type I restriction enzyme R subunit